ncbi:MAG: GMC family oxidoreductase [Bacteroidota bacterium]
MQRKSQNPFTIKSLDQEALQSDLENPLILQPSNIDHDVVDSADVCIIGSGCGGAVCAKEIGEAGHKVIIVEEGGYYTSRDFTMREDDAYAKLYKDRASQTTDDLSITILQGRCVGGSSTVNWTTSLRTPEWVLAEWGQKFGVQGLSRRELDPYFEKVEKYLNIHVVPDHDHNPNNRIILEGSRKLGYRAQPTSRNEEGCLQCGFCGLGCPFDVKLSVNLTYVPDALHHGATLYANARAEIIELKGKTKIVKGSILDNQSNRVVHKFEITAPIVIVAASAINSPVLLLRSNLANSSGQVGKTLTLHPTTAVFGLFEEIIDPAYGIPQSATCDEFLNRDGDGTGFWIEAVPVQPALAAISLPEFGETHRRLMRMFPHIGASIILVKDTDSEGEVKANEHSRPVISFNLGRHDLETMKHGIKVAAQIHFAAGAREVTTLHVKKTTIRSPAEIDRLVDGANFDTNSIVIYSAHPLGTCRMGENPKTAVVNSHCETHDVQGLFVCDGSVTPTSLGVNPQVTIMGIATKTAEYINENFSRWVR